jgi:3',5'-cyclic AMP phosphodiesterase CpdA
MTAAFDRRDFLKLSGVAGVVFASGLGRWGQALAAQEDFYFLQMSDTHWGFEGPAVNPEAATTLPRAIALVNALPRQPDFIVFTGDLIHTSPDEAERRRRLQSFQATVAALTVKDLRFLPGEHDAGLDLGRIYHDIFGASTYSFDHKGVHFIVLDNVSSPEAALGDAQLAWLKADLAARGNGDPIVVLTHRPLFDLYPAWDWATQDGDRALELLMPYRNVTVFYGHIHQEHHHMTGHIAHHAARSLIFPQPAPGSQPKRLPVPWDPAHPFAGLGFRTVQDQGGALTIEEHGVA